MQYFATIGILNSMRREYKIAPMLVNGRPIEKVVIDPHVDKHRDHINDEIILEVVSHLNGGDFSPVSEEDGFSYFANVIKHSERWYKIVWLLEEQSVYLGVITIFKDRREKK